jgi:hypothetical protein
MNQARLPMTIRRGLWAKAARYATDMRNYLVTSKSPMSSYEKFMGSNFDKIDTLHSLEKWQLLKIAQAVVCAASYKIVVNLLSLKVQRMTILVIHISF